MKAFFLIITIGSMLSALLASSSPAGATIMLYAESRAVPVGTAFIINIHGEPLVITAAHTITESKEAGMTLTAALNDKEYSIRKSIILDPKNDIGMLTLDANLSSVKSYSISTDNPTNGTQVRIENYSAVIPLYDFTKDQDPAISVGYIAHGSNSGSGPIVIASTFMGSGASGSPVLDSNNGALLGMVTAAYINQGYTGLVNATRAKEIVAAYQTYRDKHVIREQETLLRTVGSGDINTSLHLLETTPKKTLGEIARQKDIDWFITKASAMSLCRDGTISEKIMQMASAADDVELNHVIEELHYMLKVEKPRLCGFASTSTNEVSTILRKLRSVPLIKNHYLLSIGGPYDTTDPLSYLAK